MNKLHVYLALSVLIIPALAVDSNQSVVNTKAPQFTLLDQYNRPYNIKQDEGKLIILLASDRDGSVQNEAWVKSVEKRYRNEVTIIGIADLRGVPRVLKLIVLREFKKCPASVLMDWNGDVFISYGLAQKAANIVLIDRKGFIRYIYYGEATTDARESLFKEIDVLSNK